jgi:hypothetical protein
MVALPLGEGEVEASELFCVVLQVSHFKNNLNIMDMGSAW